MAGRLEGRKLEIIAVLPGTAQRKTVNVPVTVTGFWLPGGGHSSWKEQTLSMFHSHYQQRGQLILNAPLKQNWWRICLRITTLRSQPRGHQENLCSVSSGTAVQEPPGQERPQPMSRSIYYPMLPPSAGPLQVYLLVSRGAWLLALGFCSQGFESVVCRELGQCVTTPLRR